MAFLMVCPDRIDLIHKNYRKFCNLLVDVDEWGQVMILNLLTRYARTQFLDPNKEVCVCVCMWAWVGMTVQKLLGTLCFFAYQVRKSSVSLC